MGMGLYQKPFAPKDWSALTKEWCGIEPQKTASVVCKMHGKNPYAGMAAAYGGKYAAMAKLHGKKVGSTPAKPFEEAAKGL